jgi:hypothetical protein
MTELLAIFHFGPLSLNVRGDALGLTRHLVRDGHDVLLTVPPHDAFFGRVIQENPAFRGEVIRRYSRDAGGTIAAVCRVVQLAVAVRGVASSVADTEAGRADGSRVLTEALPVALGVMGDLVGWLRLQDGQRWLGPSHEQVPLLRFDLIDAEHGGTVRNVSIPQDLAIIGGGEAGAASRTDLDTTLDRVAAGMAIPVPEELLADAREEMTPPSVSVAWQADERDVRRAVILTAIACEVKIKGKFAGPLPRADSVAKLVHKPMHSAFGRSLCIEDQPLYERVIALFRVRNQLAHGARQPTIQEATDAVAAATRLFAWLDGV